MNVSAHIVDVDAGEDLMQRLEACGPGWVTGVGSVEAVELRVAGEGADPVRALRGRFTLVSLGGPSGGAYGVVLARATDAGLELLGGELVRARSLGVQLSVIAAAAPGGAERQRPGASPAPAARPPAEERPALPASGWAAAAAASARAARPVDSEGEEVFPEPGDLVRHFAFGLCEVLVAEHDRLKIRDLHGPGRIREIRTDRLQMQAPTEHDGKRLFQLERKR